MTAVVAIMNKSGIALAADSAVTVTNGTGGYSSSKIYNTANKLFMLSKYHPVGIMVYSSAAFMQVPWELIIKLYRKYLGDRSFDTIADYRDDFLNFLVSSSQLSFIKKETNYLSIVIYRIISQTLDIAEYNLRSNLDIKQELDLLEEDESNKKYIEKLKEFLEQVISDYICHYEKINDLIDYDYASFSQEYEDLIVNAFEIYSRNPNIVLDNYSEFKKVLILLVYEYLTRKNFNFGSTGIVFAGFGEAEIYPSLCSIEIDGMLSGKLRYMNNQVEKICEKNTASIVPFAQKDVMQMFIEGIDPNIEQVFKDSFSKIIKGYNKILVEAIDNVELKERIQSIDINKLDDIFRDEILEAKREWQILPTINTVEILSKEDLAEMAESLVYLTFLKRRTSSSEESVGGPIDVAIISKGDGFIWKNRKHYFEKELNQHFFSNYFNH